jgi:lipoate-protein ligase A
MREEAVQARPDEPEPDAPSHTAWRLILDGDHSAAWNMAVDEAIMDAVIAGVAPPTLRLYRFEEAAITAGRFQDVERTVNLSVCRDLEIPIVRRPTGGRGILHGGDQTVSIVVPSANLGSAGRSVAGSYVTLAHGFALGCARLRVKVAPARYERRSGRGGDCFAVRSQADLLTQSGDKLLGSAQRRREGVILQQSSLRHRGMEVTAAQVFHGPAAPEAYPLAGVEKEVLMQALVFGFEEALGLKLNPGSLTGWEEERACVIQGELMRLINE